MPTASPARPDGSIDTMRALVDGLTPIDRVLACVALLFPIAYFDAFFIPSWTPRMVILLVVLPVGAVALAADARRDWASRWALGFLAWCTLATLVGPAPLWNLRGGFGRESNLLVVGGVFAVWSAARRASPPGRQAIGLAAVAGLTVSGLVGILQVISQPDAGFFALIGSRPSGLATNPVYFGAGSAAAAAAIAHAWGREHLPDRGAAVALGFFLACTNLAGSRGALVAALVAIVVAAARTAAERRIAIVVSAAIGWGASIAASAVFGGRDAAVRASSGSNGRLDVWRYGLEAFAERPVFGSGFGQFRAAVQGHFDATFVRDHASDTAAAAWPDAHNVIVQYAVVGGGGAVVLLVGFIAASARRARGPYAWAALTFGLTWLLQPVTLATGPLAMLCLGLAMSTDDEEHAGPARTLVGVPLVVGLLVGITLIGYDNRLNSTLRAGKVDAFTTWARRGPDDPVVAATTASLQTRFRSVDAGVEWSRLATRLEPWDAVARSTLAIRLLEAGNGAEAREQVARALELDPYNPVALRVARIIGDATDDAELAALAARRLDEIDE